MIMIETRVFLGLLAVFVVITLALITAVYDQRQTIYMNPSQGTRISAGLGESFFGGVWAAEGEVTDNTLFVSGSATASDNPDKVTILFSVETQDDSALVSQQENAQKTATVRSALMGIGLESDSIETTSYNLAQVREYNPDTRTYVNKGFKTTHSMKVELSDISKAGEVIDTAVSAGTNNINGIYFGLSDSKLNELRMQALESAAENARDRADSIAKGLGVTVNRVMSASESYTPSPVYRNYAVAEASVAGADESTEITPGDVSVTATVSVVFEIS
jgi:uncharacterized protein YggE